MSIDPVLARARRLWKELARVPVSFDRRPPGAIGPEIVSLSWNP